MAEPRAPIPHLGDWSVEVSRFLEGLPQAVVPDAVRDAEAMSVTKTVEGLEVRFLAVGVPTDPFPCRVVADDVLEMAPTAGPSKAPAHSFLLRLMATSAGAGFLVGVWLDTGRGDAPVGVWVSKEEGRPDDD